MTATAKNIVSELNRVARQIGNTPLIPIYNLHQNNKVQIFAKAEWHQLSGSVKARAAFNIIKQAVLEEKLTADKILLDATSGNTGIAYATIGKILGIKVALCLPENASRERKEILQSLGAEIIFTSRFGGTDDAQEKAQELAELYPDTYYYANQYCNENNWKAHYYGTGEEIIKALPNITHFVTGLGTSGTFVGTSRKLKEYDPKIQVISLQPDLAMHGIEGWKHLETAKIPLIYDSNLCNKNIEVSTAAAYKIIKEFKLKGISLSPSSAANIAGAVELSGQIEEGTIVTVLPDDGTKYKEIINQIL
jgi:S-sulfo-L-cysteine synthase (O-acetyl-L-serine-dependent)